jgi:sortase A
MASLEETELGVPAPRLPGDASAPPGGAGTARPSALVARPAVAAGRREVARAVGLGVTLLGVLLLGFAAYLFGLSGVQEARSQTVLYKQLTNELANAVAPVGPTAPGAPVAILNIPSIGMHDMVVVEGTSPQNLTLGPGHLRNTPLPGQSGMSVIYGRRATFGAPFSRLAQLRPGDKITVITSQGTASYRVEALAGSQRMIEDPAPNRLVLLTAGSATIPTYYVYVDADLTSRAQPSPGDLPAISTDETALSGDNSALAVIALLAIALALLSVGGTVAAMRWSPWLAYLSIAPVALAVLWILYQNLAAVLPNVY